MTQRPQQPQQAQQLQVNQRPQQPIKIGSGSATPIATPQQIQPSRPGWIKWVVIGSGVLTLLLVILIALLLLPEPKEQEETASMQSSANAERMNGNSTKEKTEPTKSEVVEPPQRNEKKSVPKKTQQPKPKPKPKSKKPKQTKSIPDRSTRQRNSRAETKPAEPSSPTLIAKESSAFSVSVNFPQEATLTCGDGQVREFVGTTKLTFKTAQVCKIEDDDERVGVVKAKAAGAIRCSVTGSNISCN